MNKLNNSYKLKKLLEKSLLHCQKGQLIEAKVIYEELLKFIPSHPQVLTNLGTIEMQLGNLKTGIYYLEKSISVDPIQPKALSNLANGLLETNKIEVALKYYDLALKFDPNFIDAYFNKARALRLIHKYDEAILNYKKTIKINPKYFPAIVNLGFLYNELKDYENALEQYNYAISLNSSNAEVFYNRGIVYDNLKDFEKALDDYDRAIEINSNYVDAYNNKSGTLRILQKYDEAIENSKNSIKIDPNNPESINKKGFILSEKKDFEGALNDFDRAIELNPNFPDALFNKAILKLSLDDYFDGWHLYDARWNAKQKDKYLKSTKSELINFNLIQKNIFIWQEQGIGDQILFSSMLEDALKTQNKFIVSIDLRMIDLYKRSFHKFSNVTFLSSQDFVDESFYDYHLPIGSLGKFFRKSIDTFKDQPKNYLKSNKEKSILLREKIKNKQKLICGIAWKSKNEKIGNDKSLSLKQLLPILSLPNVTFVDLQYGDTKTEKQSLFNEYGIEIKSIDEIDNFNDIDGLASLIDACDFVVTSSNVTAHLAGALGKKTYLLVPYAHGKIWYWHEDKDKSLWYPSISIYRQDESRCWILPIKKILINLESLACQIKSI